VNEVSIILHDFVADLSRQISGVADKDGLIQSIRPAQECFRRKIRSTAPRFKPYERKFGGVISMPGADVLDAEETDASVDEEEPIPGIANSTAIHVDEVFKMAQRSVVVDFLLQRLGSS
jgi:hypothetical protein